MLSGLREEKYNKNLLSRYIYIYKGISSDAYNSSCVEDVLRGSWGWKALHVWNKETGWRWQQFGVG